MRIIDAYDYIELRREITVLLNEGVIDQDNVRQLMRARIRQVVTAQPRPEYL
jgi:hypothetical protein